MRHNLAGRIFRSNWLYIFIGILTLGFVFSTLLLWAYEFDLRVRYRVQEAWGSVRGIFVEQPAIVPTAVRLAGGPTFAAPATATSTPTHPPTATPNPQVSPTSTSTPTEVPPTPTPLPGQVTLTGFRYEYQGFNNCGPTSLAIMLSYWGWNGDQYTIANVVKPNHYDRNVSPIELYEYGLTVGYNAYIRTNGDVDTIKRFLAAGYPVLIEKGYTCQRGERCSGWFGHYLTVSGYDDARGAFIVQDSYRQPDMALSYEDTLAGWRAFNYLYLVFFPNDESHNARVRELLGPAADLEQNYLDSLERARHEAATRTGEAGAFAWFNVGTNLHYMHDYAGAAAAYDQARDIGLPYRMLWYQFGPYRSYYYAGRYQDVVSLASFAIDQVIGDQGLEEAFYWRAQARIMMGERDDAIADLRMAVRLQPNFQPAIEALAAQGLTP
jgi:tetratricopeptide (TPR) repeat protein